MYKKIILRKGKDQSLKRFHPWVFSGAIARMDSDLEEGEIVKVYTADGEFIAVGHFQIGSIAVRVLSFEDIEINSAYWATRLQNALEARKSAGVVREDNNMYRLVHGEGDGLPGLIIDFYDGVCVLQAHSVGMHIHRKEIAEALKALPKV